MLHELVHTWVTEDVKESPTFNLVCILAVVMLLLCCMSWFTPGLPRMSGCHLPLFGLYSSCGNVVVVMLHELVHTWVTEDVRVSPTFNLVCILAVVMFLLCCMSWFTPGLPRMSGCHLPLFGLYSSCGNVVVEMLHELVHTWVTKDVRVSPTFIWSVF